MLPEFVRSLFINNFTQSVALQAARWFDAWKETGRYIDERMQGVPYFPSREALLVHSLKAVKLQGHFCEFGVWRGHSINLIAQHVPSVHGFDSFEGLPENWMSSQGKGTFATPIPRVRENVRLHVGWFSDTLPEWLAGHPGPVAFLHLDADLYSSTACVLSLLRDRIVPGTVIQFDEYMGYPGWQQHEFKAWRDAGIPYRYIGVCSNGVQAAVVVEP